MKTAKDAKKQLRSLPPGWRWVRLRDVGEFFSGGTPRKGVARYWGGEIPFVTGADIVKQYVSEGRAFLTDEGLHSGQTHICQPGTVLLVTRTRVGRVGIAVKTMGASQDISPYVCGESLLPEYAYWYLSLSSETLKQITQGSTILGLTRDHVESLVLPLPPLSKQRAIAARLEAQMAEIQRMRQAAERQLEAARAMLGALSYQVFKYTEGEALPHGWRWVRLGKVVSEHVEQCNPARLFEGTFQYIDISSVDNVSKRIVSPKVLPVSEAPSRARQIVKTNDVLIASTRPNLNAVVIVPPELDGQVCSTGFCVLRAPSEELARYVFAYVQSPPFVSAVSAMVRGALYPAVTDDDIRDCWIPLPPLDEQRTITACLEAQMAETQHIRQAAECQVETINALPGALLREVFSGFEPPADEW